MKELDFSRILCPVTLSEASQQTVDEAAILAARYDAELRLLHVASLDGDIHQSAEDVIASLFALARHLPGRVRVSAAVAYGDPKRTTIGTFLRGPARLASNAQDTSW